MTRDIYYLVYDKTNLKLSAAFRSMGKEITKLLKTDGNLDCINITHPVNMKLVNDINVANGTDYAPHNPEAWKELKKGDSITIIGRRWFDRVNGNTYHSCECLVNGKVVANVEFAYGYDDQYQYSGMNKLASLGYLPGYDSQTVAWRYCEDRGITYHATRSDVNRKKDL